jgi:hypothetical protein
MDEQPSCPAAVDLLAAAGTPMGNNAEIQSATVQSGRDSGGA